MKNFNNILLFFLSVYIFQSCVPQKNIRDKSSLILSQSFSGSNDTISVSPLKVKDFFTDSLLLQLIDSAIVNNRDLAIAYQRIEAANAEILSRKGNLLPQVEGSLNASQRRFGLFTMDGSGNITTEITPGQIIPIHLRDYFPGIQASWEADIWGKLKNKKKASLNRWMGTIEAQKLMITNLVSEVSTTYYELIWLDQRKEIIENYIRLQEDAIEIIKAQKEAGNTNELAVQQFEIELLSAKASLLELEQEIMDTENKINLLLGRFPQKINRNKNSLFIPLPEKIQTGIPSDLLSNRPDIKQTEFELEACKADVKSAKAAFYPSFTINGYGGFQAFSGKFLFTTPESIVYGIFGNLTAPLINRNAIKAEFYQANATQLEALYEYEKTILNAYTEVYAEIYRMNNLQKLNELKTQELNLTEKSIETAIELFKSGRADYLEVLITQQNSLDANLEAIDIKANQFLTLIQLYRAVGGGWQ